MDWIMWHYTKTFFTRSTWRLYSAVHDSQPPAAVCRGCSLPGLFLPWVRTDLQLTRHAALLCRTQRREREEKENPNPKPPPHHRSVSIFQAGSPIRPDGLKLSHLKSLHCCDRPAFQISQSKSSDPRVSCFVVVLHLFSLSKLLWRNPGDELKRRTHS